MKADTTAVRTSCAPTIPNTLRRKPALDIKHEIVQETTDIRHMSILINMGVREQTVADGNRSVAGREIERRLALPLKRLDVDSCCHGRLCVYVSSRNAGPVCSIVDGAQGRDTATNKLARAKRGEHLFRPHTAHHGPPGPILTRGARACWRRARH